MAEKMTVICLSCEQPVFHGQPCPWCESTEVVEIEIEVETDTRDSRDNGLRVIQGGRREEDRRAA